MCLLQSCKGEDDVSPIETIDQDDDNTKAVINEQYTYKMPVIFHVFYKNASDTTQ